jgi:HK97 family phage major capsid protein
MNIEEILAAIADIISQMQAIYDAANAGTASAEDVAKVEELEKQLNDLNDQKAKYEKLVEVKQRAEQSQVAAKGIQSVLQTKTNALPVNTTTTQTKTFLRNTRVYDSNEQAYKAGKFLVSVLSSNSAAREQARKWCETQGVDYKALTSSVDGSAGLFVIPEISTAIIKKLDTYGVARKYATIQNMNSETSIFFKENGENSAFFIAATGTPTSTDVSWQQIALTAKKLAALTKYSEDLNEDAIVSLADEVTTRLTKSLSKKEDAACFVGDGSSTHGGIVGVTESFKKVLTDAGGTWTNDTHKGYLASAKVATGATWASVTLADILALKGKVDNSFKGNGKWFCNDQFYYQVMKPLINGAGGITANEIVNGTSMLFDGNEVVFVNSMPNATAVSTIPLVYGDLSQAAVFGDRQGIQIKTDNSGTNFLEDTVQVKATERFDFVVHEVGNYNSTAANQTRGAISCLITKNA